MVRLILTVAILFVSWTAPAISRAGEATVSLELATEKGFPIAGQQRWIGFLKDLGFANLRIRSAREREEPSLSKRGTADSPSYYVTGLLVSGNTLQVPGAVIRYGDRAAVTQWLAKLREGGEEGLFTPTGLWGMTARQVIAFHQTLETKVAFQTKGQTIADVVRQITRQVNATITIDPSAQRALNGKETVLDELNGISSGTAIAAAIRPLGLLLVPTKAAAGRPSGKIVDAQQVEEGWPIGFDPDNPPGQTAPSLFTFLNAEIQEEPLDAALVVLQQRVKIPMLFDHNAIARHEVDMTIDVSFAPKRTFYKKIIDTVLRKAMLKSELRVDDAGQPFLWITTIKKVP